MKYVFNMPFTGPLVTPDNITALAKHAEELGFDVISAQERLAMPGDVKTKYPYTETGEFPEIGIIPNTLELLTYLSFLAGLTSKARLLTWVMVMPYRNPLIAGKVLASIDVLSKGRLIIGCGAGWLCEEFDNLGVSSLFEERGVVTNEYIQGFKELWSSPRATFEGKYLRFSNVVSAPKPVQEPHPPFWIGGESPPAMRRVAILGDGWSPTTLNPRFPLTTPKEFGDAVDRLHRYAEEAGRDPTKLDINFGGWGWTDSQSPPLPESGRKPFAGNSQQITADIRTYGRLGMTHVYIDLERPTLEETLERMERFMTEVKPLAEE